MSRLGALRTLFRVEWRAMRRNPGRSALVVLLVAVPVAAMAGGSVLLETVRRTSDEARAAVLGAADLRVESAGVDADPPSDLPPEARVERLAFARAELRAPGRRVAALACSAGPGAFGPDGLARGLLRVTAGRAPTAGEEIAASPSVLDALARAVGDEVEIEGSAVRVVGVVVDPEHLPAPVVVRVADGAGPASRRAWLASVDDPTAVAARVRASGARAIARGELGGSDELETTAVFVLGGLGFFEAALVISAAFAVALRRRQREIGLLGASGAPIAALRTALMASAALLAGAGIAVGLVTGIAAAAVMRPFLDGWNLRWNGALELPATHLAGAAVLGLAACACATVLPVLGATRLPIRVALSGRRPVTEGTRAWLASGLALVAAGVGLVAWGAGRTGPLAAVGLLTGSILAVLGLGCCSPWLLGALARVAAPLPLAWRLAARDAGRFRARNGPVVTAVLAGVSVSLTLAALVGSVESLLGARGDVMRGDLLVVDGPAAEDVSRDVATELGAIARAPLACARAGDEVVVARFPGAASASPDAWLGVADERLLTALAAESGLADLRAGRLLALVAAGAPGDRPANVTLAAGAGRALGEVDVAWIEVSGPVRAPRFLVDATTVARHGLASGPPPASDFVPWAVRLERTATENVVERAQSIAARAPGSAVDAAILHREPTAVFLAVVLVLALVTGMLVVGIATALSSVESAADAHVLRAVGAAPRVLRDHLASRAGYLAALGCLLAVPAGLVPSYGIVRFSDAQLEFAVPWTAIAITAVGMPALTYAGAWLCAAFERPSSRVRAARG